jgi:hypothetical protein
MSNRQHLYTGRSGQLAAMSMFLFRGYNVAMPEVDVGEDIFVVRDEDGELSRIQVKAAIGKGKNVVSGVFKVPLSQLRKRSRPPLYYVFTLHHDGLWREFVVLPRATLKRLHNSLSMGHVVDSSVVLRLSFTPTEVSCSGTSLQSYRNDWGQWPVIHH